MNRWPEKPLLELATLTRGTEPGSRSYTDPALGKRFLRVGDITGKTDNLVFTNADNLVVVSENDLLITLDGTPGHVSTGHSGAISSGIRKVEVKNEREVALGWLRYAMNSPTVQTTIRQHTRGITILHASSAVPHIKIPVPPLAEQERIVKLLDEANELRKLRVQSDRRTAAFLPTLFQEIFGDPALNPRRWPMRRLRELGEKFSDGPFGSNLKSSHYTPEGVRVIRLQNIGVGNFVDDNKAYISPEHFDQLRKHECLPGDVIIGTLGEPNLRACILPPGIPQALNKADCVQIRPNSKIATAEFICWLLNLPSTLAMASGMILGQTRARISMGRLAELFIPVPPLPLQKEFAQRAGEIRELEAGQSASRQRLDALFQSLLHYAFQGDL